MGAARKNWLAAGDPLRGIAAFGVLLFHVATWAALTGTDAAHADTLGEAGRILFNLDAGVFLFFVLSGYLIGRPFWFRSRGSASAFGHQHVFPSVGFAFGPGLALAALEPVLAPALRAAPARTAHAARVALLLAAAAAAVYFLVPRQEFMKHSVLAVTAATLLFAAALLRDWAGRPAWRLLDNRPLQWLGQRSYSLYLFHLAVVAYVARTFGDGAPAATRVVLVAAIAIPISLVLSWAGYALVERPFVPAPSRPVPDEPPIVPVRTTA